MARQVLRASKIREGIQEMKKCIADGDDEAASSIAWALLWKTVKAAAYNRCGQGTLKECLRIQELRFRR